MIITLLIFILILGVLIFVHEGGHFLAARAAKIKVQEFAFGYPPRLISKTIGETKYSLNLIPFGGFVRILGLDEPDNHEHSYSRQKARVRLLVIVAGVLMNLVLAFLILTIGFWVGMVPVVSRPDELGGKQIRQLIVTEVSEKSWAESAGLKPGDLVSGYANSEDFYEFGIANSGKSENLEVYREGKWQTIAVTFPSEIVAESGMKSVDITKIKLGFLGGLKAAAVETYKITTATVEALGGLFKKLFTSGQVPEEVSGPVGIYSVTTQAVSLGLSYVLQLIALLSVNLALINLLPFPALDGGRALFVFLEGVTRRKILREEIENGIHAIGFIILIILMILLTYRDILRLN